MAEVVVGGGRCRGAKYEEVDVDCLGGAVRWSTFGWSSSFGEWK